MPRTDAELEVGFLVPDTKAALGNAHVNAVMFELRARVGAERERVEYGLYRDVMNGEDDVGGDEISVSIQLFMDGFELRAGRALVDQTFQNFSGLFRSLIENEE